MRAEVLINLTPDRATLPERQLDQIVPIRDELPRQAGRLEPACAAP
jgi:hypothetical protein